VTEKIAKNTPKDQSPENLAAYAKFGFYVQENQKGPVVYFNWGGRRVGQPLDLVMWTEIVRLMKENKDLKEDLAKQAESSVIKERQRIIKCLNRASRELTLHDPTLAVCKEFIDNPNGESDIFGSVEIN
jgi:hypothetical protein